jgi:DNA repair protein RecO (recombination protein O)
MAWSSIKTEGIVLRVDALREVDRRYRILTPGLGKIEVIGRGAQKRLAKLAPHLEPFSVLDLEVIQGRRRMTVISVESLKSFRGIASSLEMRLLAATSLSLLDKATHELGGGDALYPELFAWLSFLNTQPYMRSARSALLLGGYLLRVLSSLGYDVELLHCISCKDRIESDHYSWHAGQGGLVCRMCTTKSPETWFAARDVSDDLVKLMRFARDSDYSDLLRPALHGDIMERFVRRVQDLMMYHLPGNFETPFWTAILPDLTLDLEPVNV